MKKVFTLFIEHVLYFPYRTKMNTVCISFVLIGERARLQCVTVRASRTTCWPCVQQDWQSVRTYPQYVKTDWDLSQHITGC